MNKQMIDEWKSWEHLILDDLKRIDYRIQRFHSSTALFSVSRSEREKYIAEKLRELILNIAGEGK